MGKAWQCVLANPWKESTVVMEETVVRSRRVARRKMCVLRPIGFKIHVIIMGVMGVVG